MVWLIPQGGNGGCRRTSRTACTWMSSTTGADIQPTQSLWRETIFLEFGEKTSRTCVPFPVRSLKDLFTDVIQVSSSSPGLRLLITETKFAADQFNMWFPFLRHARSSISV